MVCPVRKFEGGGWHLHPLVGDTWRDDQDVDVDVGVVGVGVIGVVGVDVPLESLWVVGDTW